MQVKDIGEFSLIQRLVSHLGSIKKDVVVGIGDDVAVIKTSPDHYLLATCDVLVEGVHFLSQFMTPDQIGQKAVAVNISDVAAMGGVPQHLLASLVLPKNTPLSFVDGLYNGIEKQCQQYNIDVIGGNIARGKQIVINIFLLGKVQPKKLLLRSSAHPNDKVLVTGYLGDSAAGLKLLQNNKFKVTPKQKKQLLTRHVTPIPRLKESAIIADLGQAISMIDISDGLSSDIGHICDQSNVGVRLWADKLPISPATKKVAKLINQPPWKLAFKGGEDYELCFTIPAEKAESAKAAVSQKTKTPVTIIGEILPLNQGKWIVLKNNHQLPLQSKSWDHFK